MFEHDRSAARGEMAARKLIVFKHACEMGNAPAHTLFDAVKVSRVSEGRELPARRYSDYTVTIDKAAIGSGVEVIERI
jgi:CRISPR-associated protein Csd2